jgi:aminoglycoside 6-adenylyltransferase
VKDKQDFIKEPSWVDIFGERIIKQEPEGMSLFPPDKDFLDLYTYLMLFTDGNRIDMTLVDVSDIEKHIYTDSLMKVLLDKDGLIPPLPKASDADYWVQKPSADFVDDCCNEFWWLSTYVAKGLCRHEFLYAAHHLELMREQLLQMLSWDVGLDTNFSLSVGKSYKYLERYVNKDTWRLLLRTFDMKSETNLWGALHAALALFRSASKDVSSRLGYKYPNYDEKVTAYLNAIWPAKEETK